MWMHHRCSLTNKHHTHNNVEHRVSTVHYGQYGMTSTAYQVVHNIFLTYCTANTWSFNIIIYHTLKTNKTHAITLVVIYFKLNVTMWSGSWILKCGNLSLHAVLLISTHQSAQSVADTACHTIFTRRGTDAWDTDKSRMWLEIVRLSSNHISADAVKKP